MNIPSDTPLTPYEEPTPIQFIKAKSVSVDHSVDKYAFPVESNSTDSQGANKIQSLWQGANKIQSLWQGYVARNALPALYIKNLPKLNLPKALNGNTAVYLLPKALPFVLKKSGSEAGIARLEQMDTARLILKKNGYKTLVIPKARIHGNFLIEGRIPFKSCETHFQMFLYAENREKFTQTAKELVRFLCQADIHDLVGGLSGGHPLENAIFGAIPRYDNLPLYLENDQGKVGLIDLEKWNLTQKTDQGLMVRNACCTAIHFFPYHFEEIINEVKKNYPEIEISEADSCKLEKIKEGSLKRLKLVCEDPVAFLNKKGITPSNNPTSFTKLTEDRKIEIQHSVKEALLTMHNSPKGINGSGCLGKNPEEVLENFSNKTFPKILNEIYRLIDKRLNKNKKLNPSSTQELCNARTARFDCNTFSDLESLLQDSLPSLNDVESAQVAGKLFKAICKELEKGGDIAGYIELSSSDVSFVC